MIQVIWTSWNDGDELRSVYTRLNSIRLQQTPKPARMERVDNGADILYSPINGDTLTWYIGVNDGEGIFNMLRTGGEDDEIFDPESEYSLNEGWYPSCCVMRCTNRCRSASSSNYYISPGHINTSGSRFVIRYYTGGNVRDTLLYALNNVNIVMTPDTNEWTRCMVVETATYITVRLLGLNIPSSRKRENGEAVVEVQVRILLETRHEHR